MEVGHAVTRARERVAAAARRSGRRPEDVRVVAVTKGVGLPSVREAVEAGLADLGENRARDLRDKAAAVGPGVRWHYLGAVQTNKVSMLDGVDLVHGLCRRREAAALQARGERTGHRWDVLVQVNVAREATKRGIEVDEVEDLLIALEEHPLVEPRGFMFMAPRAENAEDVRWIFEEARSLRDRFGLEELSMGMSHDFEAAIEEGATAIFQAGPIRILTDDRNRVTGVEFIRMRLGHYPPAESAYRQAVEVLQRLAAAHPDNPDHRTTLGNCLIHLAQLYLATGRPDEAERAWGEAQRAYAALAAGDTKTAAVAATDLDAIAEGYGTTALRAAAELARGNR